LVFDDPYPVIDNSFNDDADWTDFSLTLTLGYNWNIENTIEAIKGLSQDTWWD
jgi:hypothetical protein